MAMISEWLERNTARLKVAGVATARLDCLVLLCDELACDKAWLLSHSDEILQGSSLKNLNTKIVQRAQHIPLAYLRGHAEFYGRDFAVNEHTLVPRPETEAMIELLKQVRTMETDVPGQSPRYRGEGLCIVDIGTGSGAIAITAKLELPDTTVVAIDIDAQCLAVAQRNAEALGASITFLQGDLADPLKTLNVASGTITILLCNLPYVPDNFSINTAAGHEPRLALFGGEDGLDLYRRLFVRQLENVRPIPQYILTESLPSQHTALAAIAKAAGFRCAKTDDFIQLFERV